MNLLARVAVQMLEAGWTVKCLEYSDMIRWRSPDGISGSELISESLDAPPIAAVKMARDAGHIVDISRTLR